MLEDNNKVQRIGHTKWLLTFQVSFQTYPSKQIPIGKALRQPTQ
jgi:hypothetical protein